MYRVLECLTTQHDYRLVLLAVAICATASITAFGVYSRAVAADGIARYGWLLLTAGCAATGIWATHFVAMVAYKTVLPVTFDPVITAASFTVAVLMTTAGFVLCARGTLPFAILGGAVIGIGIGSMHYLGMEAVILPGFIEWDRSLLIASIVLGIGLSALSIGAFHWLEQPRRIWISALLLALAISALHFTGMAAAEVRYDPTVVAHAIEIDHNMMAIGVAAVTVFVLLVGLIPAFIDNQSSKESSDRLKGLFEATSDGMVVATNGRIDSVNGWIAERRGLSPKELVGMPVVGGLLEGIPENLELAEPGTREARMKLANGTTLAVEVVGQPIRTVNVRNEIYIIRDLTERRRAEARITYLAYHDPLSGLPNRKLAMDRIRQSLIELAPGTGLAVLCINIDNFKQVNDRFGNTVGDAVLLGVAQRLRDTVHAPTFAARLGSDEFAIVQTHANQQIQTIALTQQIIRTLAKPFDIEGESVSVSASVGISMAPDDGFQVDTLLRNAGLALCKAKASGPGSYVFYQPEHETQLRARHQIESDLRIALRNSQFELHYQPIVNVKTGSVSCFEALIRWRHPQRGLISPDEFIPVAEDNGLIVAIGDWALRRACHDAVNWPAAVKVAVNLSAVQFEKSNVEMLTRAALSESKLPAQRLELEVTEGILLQNESKTQGVLANLRKLGVSISLDDFGTAFASLDYLRTFPFDKIKIDQTFIRDTANRTECMAIVRAVTGLAHMLGLKAVAEGVESELQYDEVRDAGCDEAQGYYFSRAVPSAGVGEVISQLKSNKPRAQAAA
jgi:diguanylate cyclase (GGDEF)-like protein/PAS domain S-box-containing protein